MMNIDQAIKSRKTSKVLAPADREIPATETDNKSTILEIVEMASFAPCHFPANAVHIESHTLKSVLPWRYYILDAQACRTVNTYFAKNEINAGKIGEMLGIASAVIQATWLPEPPEQEQDTLFEGNRKNMEHIAAASAAIQNMLLSATAKGIPTYWSSGGKLRGDDVNKMLGIPAGEVLLGSIFFFPKDTGDARILPGGMRGKGGEVNQWATWVQINPENYTSSHQDFHS